MVFTIGYEGLGVEAFMLLLAEQGVETVVDVRELPLSRKPGFSKKALANALNLSGFEYVHMVDLGCPKLVRDRYRDDSNWKRYSEEFLKHLKMQGAAIDDLCELVTSSNCALLCYEADFNFCHRSMVANEVSERCGAGIRHISAADARTASPVASLQLACA
jgi:uncharacterized protein (DUF488 family)